MPIAKLAPNREAVAAQVMDGEAIIINLTNGIYYSLDDVGGAVWDLIDAEKPLVEIAVAMAGRYAVGASDVWGDLQALGAELVEEGLAVVLEECDGPPAGVNGAAGGGETYGAPSLKRFDDMADLFALDPPMPELPALAPGKAAGTGER